MGEGITIYGLHTVRPNKASLRIKAVLQTMKHKGFPMAKPFSIGRVSADVERYASSRGIKLASREIYISPKFFSHTLRTSKGIKRVSPNDIAEFPVKKRQMHKYYDGEAFIYTDYHIKFIVHPNYKLKLPNGKRNVVNLVTAGRVTDRKEFDLKKYEQIK